MAQALHAQGPGGEVEHGDEAGAGPQQAILLAQGGTQHQHQVLLKDLLALRLPDRLFALVVVVKREAGARAVTLFDVDRQAGAGQRLDELGQEHALLARLLHHARETDGLGKGHLASLGRLARQQGAPDGALEEAAVRVDLSRAANFQQGAQHGLKLLAV